MKRLVYILFVFAGLAVVSCTKDQIRPNTDEAQQIPVWRSTSSGTNTDDGSSNGPGSITDPNNDKDESSRRKN